MLLLVALFGNQAIFPAGHRVTGQTIALARAAKFFPAWAFTQRAFHDVARETITHAAANSISP